MLPPAPVATSVVWRESSSAATVKRQITKVSRKPDEDLVLLLSMLFYHEGPTALFDVRKSVTSILRRFFSRKNSENVWQYRRFRTDCGNFISRNLAN